MGTGANEDYVKKQAHNKYKLKMLMLVILTNLLTIYIFTDPTLNLKLSEYSNHLPLPLWDSATLLYGLNSTKIELAASHSFIFELQQQLNSTNFLVEALLIELTRQSEKVRAPAERVSDDLSIVLPHEVRLAIGLHKLPLGYSPRMGSDEVISAVEVGCLQFHEELVQYMKYDIGGECPADDVFAQRLMLKGCEPLPQRRCYPRSPVNYVEPSPFPDSLWATPLDTGITWDP